MPLKQYFSVVGAALLALLFILDAYLPKFPVLDRGPGNLPVIRIHSDRKWPERIVFDTNLRTIVPIGAATAEGTVQAPRIAEASSGAKEREAFAMLPSSVDRLQTANAKRPELKLLHHRRVAKKRVPAPTFAMAPPLQPGWYGRNFW